MHNQTKNQSANVAGSSSVSVAALGLVGVCKPLEQTVRQTKAGHLILNESAPTINPINNMTQTNKQPDEANLYYYLYQHGNEYRTAMIGWLDESTVQAINHCITTSRNGYLTLTTEVGGIKFVVHTNQPLYLLDFDNNEVSKFAGDQSTLDVFPSGCVPPSIGEAERILELPSYWSKGVEPLLEFKISDCVYHRPHDVWIPLLTNPEPTNRRNR